MKNLRIALLILGSISSYAHAESKSSVEKIDLVRKLCNEIYYQTNSNNVYKAYDCLTAGIDSLKTGASKEKLILDSCSAGYSFYNTAYSARKCFNLGLKTINLPEAESIIESCSFVDGDNSAVDCLVKGTKRLVKD